MKYAQIGHEAGQPVHRIRSVLQSVLVGGASAGRKLAPLLAVRGVVIQVDAGLGSPWPSVPADLPDGQVYLLNATGDPDPRWSWTLPLDVLASTARLMPLLAGRDVTVVCGLADQCSSQVPAGGSAPWLDEWLARLALVSQLPGSPWRMAAPCREFVALAEPLCDPADPLSLARLVQQVQRLMVQRAGPASVQTITVEDLLLELGGSPACGGSGLTGPGDDTADEPIPVVIPPRLVLPDLVADRQQQAIWTGLVKHGNRWSTELAERLRPALGLRPGDELLVTRSGTDALRLAIAGIAGRGRPGDVALLPSFTFRATADVLVQLGFEPKYVDVDPWSWTLDPSALQLALADERVRLVMCVDTFGNPCSYEPLRALCAERGVPLIADSAAAIGSFYQGRPVATQATAHTFSMSFAKVLTSAGAGGALVFPAGSRRHDLTAWLGSALMDEVHAIAGIDQLAVLPDLVARRQELARAYQAVTQDLPGVVNQGVAQGNQHSYVHWVAQFPARERFAGELASLGVATKPYYEAQHLRHEIAAQPAGQPLNLPVTERLDREALALPMSSELSRRQQQRLCAAVTQAVERVRDQDQDRDQDQALERAW